MTRGLGRLGAVGLYDIDGICSVLVPDIRRGHAQAARLSPEGGVASQAPYFERPARSLASHPAFERAFDPRPHPVLASRSVVLRQARLVGPQGTIFEADSGRIYFESACSRPLRVRQMAPRRARLLGRPIHVSGPLIFLPTYGSANYYQFLTDVLTRLYAFSDDGSAGLERFRHNVRGVTFVLSRAEPEWQRHFIELLGVRASYAHLSRSTNWIVESLVFPTFLGLEHPRGGPALFPSSVLSWLRRVLWESAGVAEATPARHIYLTRSETRWRRVTNEAGIRRLLRERGFETITPERLPIRDQIRLFAQAESIVAPHGSALTNILFAGRCTVVEFVPPAYPSVAFYALSEALGHDYWYLRGRADDTGDRMADTLDYEIPLELLAATLAAALG